MFVRELFEKLQQRHSSESFPPHRVINSPQSPLSDFLDRRQLSGAA